MSKPRLASLKPLLPTLPPQIGYAVGDERGRNRERDRSQPYRQWYKTAKWQQLRWSVLVRDNFTCQRCHLIAGRKGQAIADHIVPHRGNALLFWDEKNLQCLCAECHDTVKQAEDKAFRA